MKNKLIFLNDNYFLFLVFSVFAVLFLTYLPVLNIDYIYHDDVYYFAGWEKKSCHDFSQYRAYFRQTVRPLGGLVKCLYGLSFDTIPTAKYVRLFNIFLLTAFALLFYQWLRFCKIEKVTAYAIALLTVLLVPYQVTVVQITNAHHLTGALLALIAIKVSTEAVFNGDKLNKKKLLLSFVIMSAALLTYPPAAMLYWTFLAIYFFTNVERVDLVSVKKLFLQAVPAIFSMVVPILWGLCFGKDERSTVDLTDGKIQWFFQDILPISSSYFDAFTPGYMIYVSCAIIAIGVGVFLLQNRHRFSADFFAQGLLKLAAGFGFLVMTFSPMLLLTKYMLPHRIFIAISSLVLFYVIFSLRKILSLEKLKEHRELISKIATFVMVLIAAKTVNYNIGKYYIRHSNLTYNFFKQQMSQIDWKNPDTKVHVILSRLPYMTENHRADEFGLTTTFWASDVIPLMFAVSEELKLGLIYDRLYQKGDVTVGDEKKVLGDIFKDQNVGRDRIIIDTNRILVQPYADSKTIMID